MDWFTALARPSLTDDDEDDKQEVASTVNPDVAASVGTIPPSLPDSDNTDDPPAKNDPPVPRRAKAPPSLEAKPLSGLGVVMGESGVTTPTTTLYPPAPEETPSEIPGSTPGGATPPSASDRLAAALDAYRKQRGSLDDVSWIARAAEGGAAGFAKRKTDNSIGDRIHGMYKDALQRPLDDAAADEKVNALRDSENRDASVRAAFPDAARMFGDRAKADDVIGWLKTRAGLDATDALTRKNLREPAVDPTKQGTLAERERHNKEMERIASMRAGRALGGGSGASAPTDDAVELGSEVLLTTGAMPSLGAGSGSLRAAILARAGEKIRGGDKRRLPESMAQFSGEKKTVAQQTQRAASVDALAQSLNNTLDVAAQNAGGVKRSGIPFLDKPFIEAQSSLGGSVPAQNLEEALATARGDYARLLSLSAGGAGQPSDADMRRAERVLPLGMTPGQVEGAKQQIRILTEAAKRAHEGVRQEHVDAISKDSPATAPAQITSPRMSLADVVAKHGAAPAGKVWVYRNGVLGKVSTPLPTDEEVR